MRGILARRATLAAIGAIAFAAIGLLLPSTAHAVPGFARQTGLACEACHTVFPELTPFGRQFKLNGYVFSNVKEIKDINAQAQTTLSLADLPPISVMLMASNTTLAKSIPDTGVPNDVSQKNSTEFPQQLSIFYTGKIADNLGAFMQVTWSPSSGSIGIDNTDLRFADHGQIGAGDLIYGVTLNNNPTSQDVWNSTPAWGFPFISTVVAPPQIATPLIGAALAQQAAGLGPYLYIWNHLYLELSLYRSVPNGFVNATTGGPGPLDSSNALNINGVAPYWRAAWQQDWDKNSLSVGTFGMSAKTHPTGVGFHGGTNNQTDIGVDAQYQWIGEDNIASGYFTYIHESRKLSQSGAANSSDDLNTIRLTGSYFYQRRYGGSLSFFSTTGSNDPGLYTPAAVVGSNNGSPNTQGLTAELVFLPWLNTKLGLQYTAYFKFNGSSSNYDGFGRSASDNNTLFVYVWTSF